MRVDSLEFDWDAGNREKCQKHGLSVRDVESIFRGSLCVFPDPEHSSEEERFIGIGQTEEHRSLCGLHVTEKRRSRFSPTDQRAVHAQERNRSL